MNAINSLWHPASEANHNVRALLGSTEEVVERTKTFCRWFQLWRAEARHGWTILGRFKARAQSPSSEQHCMVLCMWESTHLIPLWKSRLLYKPLPALSHMSSLR